MLVLKSEMITLDPEFMRYYKGATLFSNKEKSMSDILTRNLSDLGRNANRLMPPLESWHGKVTAFQTIGFTSVDSISRITFSIQERDTATAPSIYAKHPANRCSGLMHPHGCRTFVFRLG